MLLFKYCFRDDKNLITQPHRGWRACSLQIYRGTLCAYFIVALTVQLFSVYVSIKNISWTGDRGIQIKPWEQTLKSAAAPTQRCDRQETSINTSTVLTFTSTDCRKVSVALSYKCFFYVQTKHHVLYFHSKRVDQNLYLYTHWVSYLLQPLFSVKSPFTRSHH